MSGIYFVNVTHAGANSALLRHLSCAGLSAARPADKAKAPIRCCGWGPFLFRGFLGADGAQDAGTQAFCGQVYVGLLALLPGVCVLVLQLAQLDGGGAADHGAGRDHLPALYNGAFCHNGVFANFGVDADYGAHAYIRPVVQMVAVDYRPVAYRDAAAYYAAMSARAAHVDYDPVLHGALLAYDYGLSVAPYDRAWANI